MKISGVMRLSASIRRGGRLLVIVLAILGAADGSAKAETVQDVICKHLCPALDRGLTKLEQKARLFWEKWKGRTRLVESKPSDAPHCGVLPDGERACCPNPSARLLIEFAGENPYASPNSPWRKFCVL